MSTAIMKEYGVKQKVRARDDYTCVDCGMTQDEHIAKHGRRLDVHRLTPGAVYTVEGCVTLCRPCHKRRHKAISSSRPELVVVKVEQNLVEKARIALSWVQETTPGIGRYKLQDYLSDCLAGKRTLLADYAAFIKEEAKKLR